MGEAPDRLLHTPGTSPVWTATSGSGLAAAIGAPLEHEEPAGSWGGVSSGPTSGTVRFPPPPDVADAAPLARVKAARGVAPAPPPPPGAPGPAANGRAAAQGEPGAPLASASAHEPQWPDPAGVPPGRRGVAASAADVDELYEQVLERLRRDLVVERERVGRLVGDVSWGV